MSLADCKSALDVEIADKEALPTREADQHAERQLLLKSALNVEIADKQTPPTREAEQCPERSECSLLNILVTVIMIAAASGICVSIYHITLRVQLLEQRFEVMSDKCAGSTAGPATVTSRSTADHRRQTSATSTTTSTSSASTEPSTIKQYLAEDWRRLYHDTDERLKRGNNMDDDDRPEVGSRLPDDDEDLEESSGDDRSHESRDNRQFLLDHLYTGRRHKRSVHERGTSDSTERPQRRQRQHQQNNGQSRRRASHHQGNSPASDDADLPRQSRRFSRRSGRRHRASHSDSHADDATTGHTEIGGLKAAHFYAPRGDRKHYVSSSRPPATFPFWKAENWTQSEGHWFTLNNHGTVTVKQSGLYMVYAQLVYHDLSGRWSFGIYVGDDERVKCMTTEQMDSRRHQRASPSHGVYQHCYTSTVLRLTRLDTVSIRCLYGSRSVVMQPEFTFWGLIQLSSTNHNHRAH